MTSPGSVVLRVLNANMQHPRHAGEKTVQIVPEKEWKYRERMFGVWERKRSSGRKQNADGVDRNIAQRTTTTEGLVVTLSVTMEWEVQFCMCVFCSSGFYVLFRGSCHISN